MSEIKIQFNNSFSIPPDYNIKAIPDDVKAEIRKDLEIKCAKIKSRILKSEGIIIVEYSEKKPYRASIKNNGGDVSLASEFLDLFSQP